MNPKFLELPEEKRERIIDAGFSVFGGSDYRHASTEEIAFRAGISKGLLFYYFENKRSMHTYLFEQATARLKAYVLDGEIAKITDFFDYCACAARRKCELLSRNPHILDFIMRAAYSKEEPVSEEVNRRLREETETIAVTCFRNIDLSRFRPDVDFRDIYRMLIWMTEGYLVDRARTGRDATLDEMMREYLKTASYLKRISYKEEFLA